MALKDVLVYLDQTKSTRVRLRLAVDLAVRNASRLTALYVRKPSAAQLDERNTAELGHSRLRNSIAWTGILRAR